MFRVLLSLGIAFLLVRMYFSHGSGNVTGFSHIDNATLTYAANPEG